MKGIKLFSGILCITGWSTAFLFFMFHYRFAFNYETEINDHYYLVFSIPFLLLVLVLNTLGNPGAVSLKKILWLLPVIAICLLLLFSNKYSFGNEYFVVLVSVFFLSSTVALTKNKKVLYGIITVIIATFFFELYTGLQQWLEAKSYGDHTALAIKGTLQNSGVYACYLVVHLPMLSHLTPQAPLRAERGSCLRPIFTRRRQVRCLLLLHWLRIILPLAAFVLSGLLIYHTQSRTAYIAFFITVAGWAFSRYGSIIGQKLKPLPKALIVCTGLGMLALTAFAGYYLFGLKKMSAMGRLMKTEIALQHIADHFWTGTGIGRFAWYYPQWQAQYFKETPLPPQDYFLSAGESYIIFNEYLQWFPTVGIIGAIITIVLLVYFFKTKPATNNRLAAMLKLTAVAIMACGFTSYPLHINALLSLLAFCIVGLFVLYTVEKGDPTTTGIPKLVTSPPSPLSPSPKGNLWTREGWSEIKPGAFPFTGKKRSPALQYSLLIACPLLLSATAYKGIVAYRAATLWQQAREDGTGQDEATKLYATLYSPLKTDGKFLTDYGTLLSADSVTCATAATLLQGAAQLHISRQGTEQLVQVYKKLNRLPEAIALQQWLCHFLPNRFLPRLELMQLYQAVGDSAKAKEVAADILAMPVKLPSAEVESIKHEAEKLMNEP
ncbi:O-antigen ligase family protein [Niabella aquatica]